MKTILATVAVLLTACNCATVAPSRNDVPPDDLQELKADSTFQGVDIAYIRFGTDVNGDSVAATQRLMIAAMQTGAAGILLEFNSGGGSVGAGFELAKTIEFSPIPVVCLVDMEAASMAAFLVESCPTRVMTRRSVLMFHEIRLSGEVSGQPNEFQSVADMLAALNRALAIHCHRRMTVSLEFFMAKITGGRQWWLGAEEALEVGAIDYIVDSTADVMAAMRTSQLGQN